MKPILPTHLTTMCKQALNGETTGALTHKDSGRLIAGDGQKFILSWALELLFKWHDPAENQHCLEKLELAYQGLNSEGKD